MTNLFKKKKKERKIGENKKNPPCSNISRPAGAPSGKASVGALDALAIGSLLVVVKGFAGASFG